MMKKSKWVGMTLALLCLSTTTMMGEQRQRLLPYQDESLPVEVRVKDALSRMTLKEKCRLSYAQGKFSSPGVPRLGIPELWMSDGPHGVRVEINWNDWGWANWTNDSVTAFPALTALTATWEPGMAALYGMSVGEEARYREKDVLLGPGVNIYRTPLNGRNFEYMGEDPYLSSTMVVPYIQELQKNGVAACVKHFVLNDQEEFRGHVDVRVSDRALHEIYLAPFKAAVEKGDAWSVMGSYNQYNDIHCCHNPFTINNLLKGELGFKGAVISDWGGAHDTREAALYGLDIEMGSYTNGLTTEAEGFTYDDYYLGNAYYNKALKGEIPMDVVNDKAARVLTLNFKTAMNSRKPYGSMNTAEHIAAARSIGNEAIVLLKNDRGLLPLDIKKYRRILVVGENATRALCPGGGSSELKARDEVSPLRGLKERFGNDVEIIYKQGYNSGKCSYDGIDDIADSEQAALRAEAVGAASDADLIIYIGGLNKNHFEDCEGGDRRSFHLSYGQDELISSLAETGKPMFLHEREAHSDMVGCFSGYPEVCRRSVIHCFTGKREVLEKYLDMGFYIGITGWICDERRGAALRDAVKILPLDRVLLETDAPYLTPRNVKKLPRTNVPQNIVYVAEELAKNMEVSVSELEAAARKNTEHLFGIGSK